MKTHSILVVEDDPPAAQYLALTLRDLCDKVRTVPTAREALLAMESEAPDLAFLDLRLPDMDGLELLGALKQRWPGIPIVFVTASDDVATVVEAVRRGAVNYLVKPVPPATLQAALERALATSSPLRLAPAPGLPEIVGISKAMVQVRHLASLAARSDVNVLITGQTGTGKELVARAIHRLSSLHDGPFVPHNCATTPPELFDSEFFGHRRGAFTGADRDHVGLLVRAHRGVLFLDELESLGLPQQAKLLRVLDDGEVRPVGSSEAEVVSVRFLAATNREPSGMVREGALREDLYYRLRGFEIRLPALKDRREDIPPLTTHYLGDAVRRLTPDALRTLRDSAWPGNVRQFRNVLRSALVLAGDGPIDTRHLVGISPTGVAAPERSLIRSESPSVAGARSLKELEHEAILQALRDFNGNRSRVARALGMHRSTLRRKIRQSGIRFPG